MGVLLKNDIAVIKALNNNIVLINDNNVEKIIISKGVGFNKKAGDIIKAGGVVEKVFCIEDENNIKRLAEVYREVDNDLICICEEELASISGDLENNFEESIHFSIAENIYLMIKRIKISQIISNPFISETKALYNEEMRLATRITNRVSQKYNIEFSDNEIGFIALHINSAKKRKNIKVDFNILEKILVENIEEYLKITINKKTIEYARFLTHIKFAIQRILNGDEVKNDLIENIIELYPESYNASLISSKILEDLLEKKISIDETAYIAVHIERFRRNSL